MRSLGRRGHIVGVCSHEMPCLSAASRWTAARFLLPDPLVSPDDFLAGIRRVTEQWRADVVLPVTDQSSLAILPASADLRAHVAGPSIDAFRRVSSKPDLLARAAAIGIATPHQIMLENRDTGVPELRDVVFPAVIKAAHTVAGGVRHSVRYAADIEELHRHIKAMPEAACPLLIQQRIVGPGVGVFLLIWDDAVIASFAHERIRELPPSGGASVYSRSIPMPPLLMEASTRLLLDAGWRGAAMVEYKRERATGKHYIMEVNGRLWGSLQLAVDAGVDFPGLLVDAARGLRPKGPETYRLNARVRSIWGDLALLISRLQHSPEALKMAPGSGGRLAALADFCRWSPGDRLETLRWDDPSPFWFEARRKAAARLRKQRTDW